MTTLQPLDPDLPALGYLTAAHPLFGGEYYRATRPGALAHWKFGWATAAGNKMGTPEDDDDGPLMIETPNQTIVTPQIFIVRPVKEWRQHWTDQAHANGQLVVADLDDDLWAHEKYNELNAAKPDNYDEWFWNVDAVLVATKHMKKRLIEMGHKAPIVVAPNCYDPFGMNSNPRPSNIIGTRLWMGGRMEADLEMYDQLVQPLLEEFGLMFTHVGADAVLGRFIDRGWDEERLIERTSVPIPLLAQALEGISIGTICMSDHPYNDAKTETHAIELGSAGIPLVAASNHPLYRTVPGRVDPTKDAVRDRIKALLDDPYYWLAESDRVKKWSRSVSLKSETAHLGALLQTVNLLLSR